MIDINSILKNLNIESLNEMQEATRVAATSHDNIVLLSNTGSGKTLAFLLPLLERFTEPAFETQALIIAPTRELATQIEQVFKQLGTGHKITSCYGGHKRETEENNLIQAPKIIVGTPGRLCDHIRRGNIQLDTIHSLVIDEYDKSLEYGYTEEIEFIIDSLPNIQHRMFTSATQAVEIPEYASMDNAHIIDYVVEEDHEWDKILHYYTESEPDEKSEDLFKILADIGSRSCIIFCNHKESVEKLSVFLKERRISNVYYHGSMEQRDRDAALIKFRNGSVNYLVTTDLASRGLDIPNIRYIIHYQMPHTADILTHRNGRTARMDASGSIIYMLIKGEPIREYFNKDAYNIMDIPAFMEYPPKSQWVTLYFPHGKKNKVNKIDIVGFLSNIGGLQKDDIGLIEVKDFHSFAAVRRSKCAEAVHKLEGQRIKGKLAKVEVQK